MIRRMDHFTVVTDRLTETVNFYAMLGLKAKGKGQAQPSGVYWTSRNPNAAGKNTGNKRK